MKFVLMAVRIGVDAVFGYLIYVLYNWGVKTGIEVFQIDFWFTRFTFGIIGVSIALALFSWAKKVLFYLFKCCDVYLAMNSDCKTVGDMLSGVTSRFGSVITIPIFNSVIRASIRELVDKISTTNEDGSQGLASIQELDNTLISKIMKCGKAILIKTFDYADECVLGYCFKNKNKSLADSAIEAMVLFIKNLNVLLPKMFTVSITVMLIRIVFFVISIVCTVSLFGVSLDSIIIQFLCIKIVSFVFEDAVIEPSILYSIVNEFSEFSSDGMEGKESIFDLIPSLEDVTKLGEAKSVKNAE